MICSLVLTCYDCWVAWRDHTPFQQKLFSMSQGSTDKVTEVIHRQSHRTGDRGERTQSLLVSAPRDSACSVPGSIPPEHIFDFLTIPNSHLRNSTFKVSCTGWVKKTRHFFSHPTSNRNNSETVCRNHLKFDVQGVPIFFTHAVALWLCAI